MVNDTFMMTCVDLLLLPDNGKFVIANGSNCNFNAILRIIDSSQLFLSSVNVLCNATKNSHLIQHHYVLVKSSPNEREDQFNPIEFKFGRAALTHITHLHSVTILLKNGKKESVNLTFSLIENGRVAKFVHNSQIRYAREA